MALTTAGSTACGPPSTQGSDLQPVGPALLGALGILRMQRDDLDQRHRAPFSRRQHLIGAAP